MVSKWNDEAKRLLKNELKRSGMTYSEVARHMTEIGLPETENTIANKVNRGTFSAAFLLGVLCAIKRGNEQIEGN